MEPNYQLSDHISESDRSTIFRIIERITKSGLDQDQIRMILHNWMPYVSDSADPAMVMVSFERFMQKLELHPDVFSLLPRNIHSYEILQKVFSSSRYLSEVLIRNPSALTSLTESRMLARPKSHDQLYSEALNSISSVTEYTARLNALRTYQSAEILRIGVCDLTDQFDLWAVTRQLSNLADALIRASLKVAAEVIGGNPTTLSVIGMGKLGGRELNYSSDIDLIFISESDPIIAEALGKKLIESLALATENGFLYRVDMRLRPWGRVGPLVINQEGFIKYLQNHARHWERQALQKARIIAGDLLEGQAFLEKIQPYITGGEYSDLQAYVRGMRQKTVAKLEETGTFWGEVKQGQGSIRDVEFTAQFLQLVHGKSAPEIRTPNTVEALNRLSKAGFIQPDEYRILMEGYVFQRTIEHFLQLLDYRQIHQIPSDPIARDQLARRLGFDGEAPGEKLVLQYEHQVRAINQIYWKYLGDETRMQTPENPSPTISSIDPIHAHIRRMTGSYQDLFSSEEINQHASSAEKLTNENPVDVDAIQIDAITWKVTIVAFDFPGELSVITGLLFIYKLDILNGEAFTYKHESKQIRTNSRRKIVDVFYVQPILNQQISSQMWKEYQADLSRYHQWVRQGKQSEVQRDITYRFAAGMMLLEPGKKSDQIPTLYPIKLEIDNESSPDCTVLRIDALDTTGFLFEFTNALALNGIYIDRVMIETIGSHVQDILFVTDANGNKILDPLRQQEMKTATLLIKQFTHLLPYSPNPESALIHFRDFIEQLFQRPNWTSELVSVQKPEVMQALARVLGVSDFLWEDFLRLQYSNLFPVITNVEALQSRITKDELQTDLASILNEVHPAGKAFKNKSAWMDALTAWRDREMLRIDMRHILGHNQEFWDFADELTDLAEVIINALFHHCHEDLRSIHGVPLNETETESHMAVLALGKFGGKELGFASDIELMFVYDKNGITSGPQPISTAEFFEKLVENFTRSMRARREGIFQIDLQLRPYGKTGNLAVSLDSFKKYYAPAGPAWTYERQALVKLRPVAGDQSLGEALATIRDNYIYTENPFDALSMRAMRERQIRHLVQAGSFNLKYSMGGLVDVEYLVQGLQIANGYRFPSVRQMNTRAAMSALLDCGVLTNIDFTHLKKAHTFLRWMIDSLRVVRGNAKDVTVPPDGSDELAFLARRMRYGEDVAALKHDLLMHQANVQEINQRLLR